MNFPWQLVAVTDPKGRVTRPGFTNVPRTATEFAEHFKKSALADENRNDMTGYEQDVVSHPERARAYRDNARAEHAAHFRKGSPYTISLPMQIRGVMLRRVQILRGNMLPLIIQIGSVTLALIMQII